MPQAMAASLSVDGQDGALLAQATGLRNLEDEGLPVRRNLSSAPLINSLGLVPLTTFLTLSSSTN